MTSLARHSEAEASRSQIGPNAFRRAASKAASIGRRVLGALVPFGAAVAALYPVAIVAGVVLFGLTLAGPAASA